MLHFQLNHKVADTASQVWHLQADNSFEPIQCNNGKVVDIRHGNTANGAQIHIYAKHMNWNQQWEMIQAP